MMIKLNIHINYFHYKLMKTTAIKKKYILNENNRIYLLSNDFCIR